jgi:hypothetical protein
MVIWYIGMSYSFGGMPGSDLVLGSGHGTGNPFGLAAAFGVFLIPLLFARLFWAQRMVESIMLAVSKVTSPFSYADVCVVFRWIGNSRTGGRLLLA